MMPTPRLLGIVARGTTSSSTQSRLVYSIFSLVLYVPRLLRSHNQGHPWLAKREFDSHQPKFLVFAVLIPVLVLLSGVFAGLTLGYMSLDETQLNVLSISGTPKQREYANKIKPIRENGHLLLVTLLLANMIVNESLPVISDPVLGGGVQSVVVSTVLIVIFAEIIPQSLFTRHGLYLGAKCAGFTKLLIYALGIVAWPIAKLLEFILGPHHGIIYRRAELKELIAMHSSMSPHGGDLENDTVTIIGATLDLQEKVVRQVMTSISDVFMLSIDAKLDYDLLKKICDTGHSRVPVYEEIELPASVDMGDKKKLGSDKPRKVKKILGILLVKHCVLLDPNEAIPIRRMPLNRVLFVPSNESLLGILDRFQEGRSHMAIVSRFSAEKAASVKQVVKRSLTQRLKETVGLSDSSDSESESEGKERRLGDLEMNTTKQGESSGADGTISRVSSRRVGITAREQSMPDDAVLGKDGAKEFLQGFDPAIMPLGIVTLEDVLEELIGEEIYDEFDSQGAHGEPVNAVSLQATPTGDEVVLSASSISHSGRNGQTPRRFKKFRLLRSRSAPSTSGVRSKRHAKGNSDIEGSSHTPGIIAEKTPEDNQESGKKSVSEARRPTSADRPTHKSGNWQLPHSASLANVLLDRKRRMPGPIMKASTHPAESFTPEQRRRSGSVSTRGMGFKSSPIPLSQDTRPNTPAENKYANVDEAGD